MSHVPLLPDSSLTLSDLPPTLISNYKKHQLIDNLLSTPLPPSNLLPSLHSHILSITPDPDLYPPAFMLNNSVIFAHDLTCLLTDTFKMNKRVFDYFVESMGSKFENGDEWRGDIEKCEELFMVGELCCSKTVSHGINFNSLTSSNNTVVINSTISMKLEGLGVYNNQI